MVIKIPKILPKNVHGMVNCSNKNGSSSSCCRQGYLRNRKGIGFGYRSSTSNISRSLITVSQITKRSMSEDGKPPTKRPGAPTKPPDHPLSGEPPTKRPGAPTSPTVPPDIPLMKAVGARRALGLPPLQPLLRVMNPGALCYAGSGLNAILCAPKITEFLGRLPRSEGLPNMARQLALRAPNQVGSTLIIFPNILIAAILPPIHARPAGARQAICC